MLDQRNDVEFFYLRPRDIATYVGSGALDVGITGRDLLLDSRSPALEIASLDFGESTFRFAGPPGRLREPRRPQGRARRDELPGPRRRLPRARGCAGHHRSARRRGRVRGASSASRMPSPTSSRPAPPCAPRAWRSSARSSSTPTAVLIASPAEHAGVAHPAAPTAGRARRAAVRAHRLRRSRERPRSSDRGDPGHRDRPPSRRCTTRSGSRCAPWCRAPTPTT